MPPVPHTTATILWTLLKGYYSLPCGLCSCWLRSEAGELMKRRDAVDYYSGHSYGQEWPLCLLLSLYWLLASIRLEGKGFNEWMWGAGEAQGSSSLLWGFSRSMPGASPPHCTHWGCGGAKPGLPTEATLTWKRGVRPKGQLKGSNKPE